MNVRYVSRVYAWLAGSLMMSVVACGGGNASAPSPVVTGNAATAAATVPTAGASLGAARIVGTLSLGAGSVPSGTSVSVSGTSISSSVDASGQFTLSNVPAGTVELKITSSSGSSTVSVGSVSAGDSVNLTVSVQAGAAAVDDKDQVQQSGQREIEGLVSSVVAGQFVVAGKTVTTSASTVYSATGRTASASDIVSGARVNVKGSATPSGVLASAIEIRSTPASLTPPVATTPTTTVDDKGGSTGGSSSSGGTTGTGIDDKGGSTGGGSTSTGGTTTGVDDKGGSTGGSTSGGGASSGGGSTSGGGSSSGGGSNSGGGSTSGGGSSSGGGSTSGGGSNSGGGSSSGGTDNTVTEVTLKGSVASKSGSCPSISFSVSGTSVSTSSATSFDLACSSVVNGTAVEVKGTKSASGTVTATSVKKG